MKLLVQFLPFGALVAAASLLSGCATPALWAKNLHHPANPPAVALAASSDRQDILVCYDEQNGKAKALQRRAYWLFAFDAAAKPKPKFTDPEKCGPLESVLMLSAPQTNALPAKGYCALVEPGEPPRFRLWRDQQALGSFGLPVYRGAPRATFWRVGLTPLAVATDAAIVGACCLGSAGY